MPHHKVEQFDLEEAQPALEPVKYKTGHKCLLAQVTAVMVKNLILLTFGTALGFPTLIIPAVRENQNDILQLNAEQLSWVGSLNSVTVPVGCLISGPLMNYIGRKRAMQFVNIPFVAAFITCGFAENVYQLYAGLILCGIAGGFMEAPVLSYVAEITQPHLRGTLSTLSTMVVTMGMLLQFLIGIFCSWRILALINCITPVIALICLQFIPESPYWLIQKGRLEDSKNSLCWLRGWTSFDNVELEYNLIKNAVDKEEKDGMKKRDNNPFSMLLSKSFIWPFSILTLLFLCAVFNGTFSLVTYSVLIFETLMVPMNSYYVTLILGICQMLGTFVCASSVHILGKRKLGIFTTLSVGICFLITCIYTYFLERRLNYPITELRPPMVTNNATLVFPEFVDLQMSWWAAYIPLVCLVASSFLAASGIRLIPWILIGELFTYEVRSYASGMAAAFGYFCMFLVNKTYFNTLRWVSLSGMFLFYSSVSFIGTVFIYYALPETEGYSLNAISDHFAKIKKLPKTVNRKKEIS